MVSLFWISLNSVVSLTDDFHVLSECPDGELPCENGVCINKNFFCDRNVDCHDGSDERDCRKNVLNPPVS